MRIFASRADRLTEELAVAYRNIGVQHACVVIKPALLAGDVAGALTLLDALLAEQVKK